MAKFNIAPEIATKSLAAGAYRNMDFIFGITVDNVVNNAMTVMSNAMNDFNSFTYGFEQGVRTSRRTFLNAHQVAATKARAAMLARYDATDEHTKPYRTNPAAARMRRFAGGRLRAALESPGMFAVSYDSIGIGDVSLLNEAAPQWARLNFGAGGAGEESYSVGPAQGTFAQGFNAGSSRLTSGPGPRPEFEIPEGFWFSGNRFYPYSAAIAAAARSGQDPEHALIAFASATAIGARGIYLHYSHKTQRTEARFQRRRITRGIRARRFIDAGIVELFGALGQEYQRITEHWFVEAERGRGPFKGGY